MTAVGDAGGDGGALTAAAGTVTDTNHPITVSDEQTGAAHRLTQLIEVDADIIPGDSGGALLESDGDVVGMNVAASSGSANITGYVIPIKRVLRIAAHVVAGEETASITLGYDAFLGVSLAGTGTALAGVVDGGAAADAGLGCRRHHHLARRHLRHDVRPAPEGRRRPRPRRLRPRHLDRRLRRLPLRHRHPRPRPGRLSEAKSAE